MIKYLGTRQFMRSLKKAHIAKSSLTEAANDIINGVSDSLGKKLHKVRIASNTKGKRGGYRSIACYKENNISYCKILKVRHIILSPN